MRITESHLRQIIREELSNLSEADVSALPAAQSAIKQFDAEVAKLAGPSNPQKEAQLKAAKKKLATDFKSAGLTDAIGISRQLELAGKSEESVGFANVLVDLQK